MSTNPDDVALANFDVEAALRMTLARLDARLPLTPITVDPELAEPKSFLKILKARHMNWTAPRLRKIFAMRFTVKLPALDQMNLIVYPEAAYDAPVFLFFCLLTGRKMICHVNVNCMSADPAYREHWVAPLLAARGKHGSFDCDDRYPEWMLRWRTPAGIYGMFPKERYGDFIRCGLDYLDLYLDRALQAAPVTEPERLAEVRATQAQFVSDIRTQDKAQGMIAKMIGAEKARRIFYEVTT
ncbi:MAG: hypothetical protein FJ197_04440 [Gammaproteobacteria bacterium]|nr:hypothetical protein [Gammaproteobacteria bacterium]